MRMIDAEPIEKFIEDGLNNPDKLKAFGHDAIEILTEIHFAHTIDPANLRTKGEWISVEDRLPEEDARVLAFCGRRSEILYYRRKRSGDGCFMYQDELGLLTELYGSIITHWMPLPEPPKEVADDS